MTVVFKPAAVEAMTFEATLIERCVRRNRGSLSARPVNRRSASSSAGGAMAGMPAQLAIMVVDDERRCLEANLAACRLLGKRLAEWVAVFCDGRKDQHPLQKTDVRLGPG